MNLLRPSLIAVALSGIIFSGIALAQTPASPQAAPSTASAPVPTERPDAAKVDTWSRKKWDATRRGWARDKQKWADCRKQAADENLIGRKSWPFLYHCMNPTG
jgi:hypothetical protein